MDIQPIPTKYRDTKFRSRLEARWAVFMDEMGVKYIYEPEAYRLEGDLFYLPDFWLPGQRIFYEIKPEHPTALEIEKAQKLSNEARTEVIIEYSQPEQPDFGNEHESAILCTHDGGVDYEYWWCECPICHKVGIHFLGRSDRLRCGCHPGRKYLHQSPRLTRAYELARAHRFWNPPGAT